ncbi:unnamed protein product [Cuscuta campestris]|uniref:Uncharacterized protein n=1 Tax=Cuscuta campestris TaxID=132261 RepID=A0A484MLG5_9ASTE|nr:unnamed protein product [Cuscuta campestris]
MAAREGTDLDRKKNESGEQRSCRRTVVKKAKGRDGVQRRFLTDNRKANRQAMITYLWRSCPSVVRNPRNGPDPRWSVHRTAQMNHLNSFGSSTCEILKLGRPKELGLVNLRPSAAGRQPTSRNIRKVS